MIVVKFTFFLSSLFLTFISPITIFYEKYILYKNKNISFLLLNEESEKEIKYFVKKDNLQKSKEFFLLQVWKEIIEENKFILKLNNKKLGKIFQIFQKEYLQLNIESKQLFNKKFSFNKLLKKSKHYPNKNLRKQIELLKKNNNLLRKKLKQDEEFIDKEINYIKTKILFLNSKKSIFLLDIKILNEKIKNFNKNIIEINILTTQITEKLKIFKINYPTSSELLLDIFINIKKIKFLKK